MAARSGPTRHDTPGRRSAFDGDLSQGFREPAGPSSQQPSSARPDYSRADRRPAAAARRSGAPDRHGPRAQDRREAPAVRREPERGSRRREEDIGERWPDLPEWATADALDQEVRRDLRGLSKEGADWTAAHLVAAGALADEEPELAWHHARAARARGGRIGVVRETVGLVAYRAGEWAEAIGELRAARRMGGGPGHLAVMADCERALGHPERAIELSRSVEADALDAEAATELHIVVAGARADLGQADAALAQIERLGLDRAQAHPRLAYAYADLLLKAGRRGDALGWFIRSANADLEEETDALERVAEISDDDSAQDEQARAPISGVTAANPDPAPGRTADPLFPTEATTGLDGQTVAQPPAADRESGGAQDAQAVDVAEPEAVDVAEPEAVDVAEPEAVDVAEPEAVDVAEPEAVDVAEPEAVDVAEPEAVDVAEPEAVDVAEPEAVDVAEPTVLFSDEPQAGDR